MLLPLPRPHTHAAISKIGKKELPLLPRPHQDLHHGLSGSKSKVGRSIVDYGTWACFLLILTGIYLWFPIKWNIPGVKIRLFFKRKLKGRPRDLNWHNVFGIWTLIPMVVVLLGGFLLFSPSPNRLLRTMLNAPSTGRGRHQPPERLKKSELESVGLEQLATTLKQQVPDWSSTMLPVPHNNAPIDVMVLLKNNPIWGGRCGSSFVRLDLKTGRSCPICHSIN